MQEEANRWNAPEEEEVEEEAHEGMVLWLEGRRTPGMGGKA